VADIRRDLGRLRIAAAGAEGYARSLQVLAPLKEIHNAISYSLEAGIVVAADQFHTENAFQEFEGGPVIFEMFFTILYRLIVFVMMEVT